MDLIACCVKVCSINVHTRVLVQGIKRRIFFMRIEMSIVSYVALLLCNLKLRCWHYPCCSTAQTVLCWSCYLFICRTYQVL